MVKVFALCVLFFVAAFAQTAVKYAGTTSEGPMFSPPVFDDTTGACTTATYQAAYVTFNATFTSPAVWEVAAMAEQAFKTSLRVYIYSSFDPAAPCANTAAKNLKKKISLSGGPVIDDYIHFAAGTYQFVVTGTSETAAGIFAVNVLPPTASGTTMGAKVWNIAYNSSGECYNYGGSTNEPTIPYGTFSWTHNMGTGYYDLYAAFYSATVPDNEWSYTYLALFEGTVPNTNNITDTCNATAVGATFKSGWWLSGKTALLAYQHLTNGVNYTLVFSGGDDDEVGEYHVAVMPTRIRFLTWTPPYVQPERNTIPPIECEESTSYTNTPWSTTVFTAENRAYLLDTQDVPDPFEYFDAYAFMYRGNNAGSSAAAPETCPLGAELVSLGDVGDVTPVFSFTTVGTNYTVVVTSYSSSLSQDPMQAYILHLFTGTPIGNLPPVPTSTGPEPGMTTTSSATTVLVSVWVFVAVVLAALL